MSVIGRLLDLPGKGLSNARILLLYALSISIFSDTSLL